MRTLIKALLGAALAAGLTAPATAQTQFITIGTGGVTGVYYPTGGAICRLVNKGRKQHGIRCSVESTAGSEYNLNTIHAGELDMGVAQSDLQHQAYNGTSGFADKGAFEELRSVFAVHQESFTVVARTDSGIRTFEDLKGKRVNVGNRGSGQRRTMEVLMDAYGWTMSDFALASELKSAEQSKALCDNKIEAMVFTVGQPNGSIKEATTSCDSVIVAVAGPQVEKLVAGNPSYTLATIPGGMYRGTDADVATFAVSATIVSSTNTTPEVIYRVVKSVFDQFADFKKLHPAFKGLKKENMIKDGLSAPLHDGSIRYFKEANLM